MDDLKATRSLRALLTLVLAIAAGGLAGAPSASAQVAFGKSSLSGFSTARPTSLQFGPDKRLYVSDQGGQIKAYSVIRTGANDYRVTGTEAIDLVAQMPNRNDSGAIVAGVTGRLITGIAVTGTAASPVVYVVSSDPRITPEEDNVDSNSGVLSKLVKGPGGWSKTDLVRGLPRSEENHTSNGLALSPDGGTLFIGQGGNTNKGAPSPFFANLPEYALSGAVLSVNLAAVQGGYDLPTLNRPAGASPFGGEGGLHQAKLVPGGPVQVHAPGFRNPYDVVVTAAGKLFAVDNGANAAYGNTPINCSNTPNDGGTSERDSLHHIPGAGYYGGHPNPTRANTANTFNGQTPVPAGNPVECTYKSPGTSTGAGKENGNLVTFGSSTNGLTEYTASNFGGALKGDLLAASWDDKIWRIDLNAAGTGLANGLASKTDLVSAATNGKLPLDVTAVGDNGAFPGTVWYTDILSGQVYVLEPADYGGAAFSCDLAVPDGDGDGFSTADETRNGTNPCSAADTPPDFDGDKQSDRSDPDDDGDGLPDPVDVFARDRLNGLGTRLPVDLNWENDNRDLGGILGLGFTGLMANGVTDYLDQYDPENMTPGGAAGVVVIDEVDPGDAFGPTNTQRYGFQFGVDAAPANGPFTVTTRIQSPFAKVALQGSQSMGVFLGTGDQDNYVKVVTSAQGGGGVQAVSEVAKAASGTRVPLALPGPGAVDLVLRVDPASGTVQPGFSVNGGPLALAGGPLKVPTSWFTDCTRGLAVGLISTSAQGQPFPATWDFLRVTPDTPAAAAPAPRCQPAPQPPTKGGDTTRPAITKLTLRPRRFAARSRGTTLTTRGKAGTRVGFRLSEAAKVRFTVARARIGRRSGSSCVAVTRRNRRGKSCTRYVAVKGSASRSFKQGSRAVRFTGRMNKRRLPVGRYRLRLRATDGAGNHSPTRYTQFTIRRR